MTQQSDGILRDADLHGVTPNLPPPVEPPPPSELVQGVHFIVLVVAVFMLRQMWDIVAAASLRDAGFYTWFYGSDFVAIAFGPEGADQKNARTRLQLWAIALALAFWVSSVALLCWRLPVSYRRDMGVSLGCFPRRDSCGLHRLAANLFLGVAAWMLLTPVVLGANAFLVWLHQHHEILPVQDHPLAAAARSGDMRPVEWGLLALSVVLAAPLGEELFFRGALTALCRKLHGGGHAAMLLAFAAALLSRRQQLEAAMGDGVQPLLLAGLPVLFVLSMTPLYAVVCWRSRTNDGPVIFGTALLFAALHSFAWPTPPPLFILGLGLGWLVVRTRSLVAPVVLHALFNAVSYVLLVMA